MPNKIEQNLLWTYQFIVVFDRVSNSWQDARINNDPRRRHPEVYRVTYNMVTLLNSYYRDGHMDLFQTQLRYDKKAVSTFEIQSCNAMLIDRCENRPGDLHRLWLQIVTVIAAQLGFEDGGCLKEKNKCHENKWQRRRKKKNVENN